MAIRKQHHIVARPIAIVLIAVSLAAGIFLRSFGIFSSEALTRDEASNSVFTQHYSINWVNQSQYTYAPGFAVLRKGAVNLLGPSIVSHRSISYLFSILSLALFAAIAIRLFGLQGACLSIVLYAFCFNPIKYALIAKQYTLDQWIALIVLMALAWSIKNQFQKTQFIVLGIVLSISLWFSFPAAFLVASVCVVVFIQLLIKRRIHQKLPWGLLAIVFGSFSVLYLSVIRYKVSPVNQGCWKFAFAPFDFWNPQSRHWYVQNFVDLFSEVAKLPFSGLLSVLFVFGLIAFYRRYRLLASFVLTTMLVVLIASMGRLYPFSGRPLSFIVPYLCLVSGLGFYLLKKKRQIASYLSMGLAAMLMLPFASHSWLQLKDKLKNIDLGMRGAVSVLNERVEPNDLILFRAGLGHHLMYHFLNAFEQPIAFSERAHISREYRKPRSILLPNEQLPTYLHAYAYGPWSRPMTKRGNETVLRMLKEFGQDRTYWLVQFEGFPREIYPLLERLKKRRVFEVVYVKNKVAVYRLSLPKLSSDFRVLN